MGKTNKIKVYLTFINKKGQTKKVHFLMDEKAYEMLRKISQEEREKYLLEEYRWFCKEQKHRRRTQAINSFYDKDGELSIDDGYDHTDNLYKGMLIKEMLNSLTPKDRELIIMYYFENITQPEIAKHFNVSERTIRRRITNIINDLKEKYND